MTDCSGLQHISNDTTVYVTPLYYATSAFVASAALQSGCRRRCCYYNVHERSKSTKCNCQHAKAPCNSSAKTEAGAAIGWCLGCWCYGVMFVSIVGTALIVAFFRFSQLTRIARRWEELSREALRANVERSDDGKNI